MKLHKLALFLMILPLTLLLDIILFAFVQSCPSCSTFSQFVAQETAFSFPIIVGLSAGVTQMMKAVHSTTHRS